MQIRLDPLALLERADKWYLGGGQAALFAPAFPAHLDTPGYWDEVHYADIRLERLYCVLLLDQNARPLTLRRAIRRWTPDRLTTLYSIEGFPTLRVQEDRVVTPDDTLACRLTLHNTGKQPEALHLLLWSLQAQRTLPPGASGDTIEEVERAPDAISFAHRVRYGPQGATPADVFGWGERNANTLFFSTPVERNAPDAAALPDGRVFVALGASRMPDSWTINLAETTDTAPLWQLSVFPEKFVEGRLAQEMSANAGWNPEGMLHLALHYVIEAPPDGTDAITFGAALALDRAGALTRLRDDMTRDVTAVSRASWQNYFASVPYFECDDPYLEHAYWYRWYGLRLLTVEIGAGQLPYPCVFEGIGGFRAHISYSAPCHIREAAWMRDPALAMGSLENFLASQVRHEGEPDDGFMPGHLYLWRQDRGFYHADWGTAARRIFELTGDLDFVRRVYPALVRYAEYFDRERDRERVALYDVLDQGETGQEYMSRYLFADPAADTWRRIQVKGVDATCYLYHLQRTLASFARALGDRHDAQWWDERAGATREAVRALMWDEDAQFFKDVDPQTLARSPYKAAVGFYPFLSDIATVAHLHAVRWHLRDRATFGTPFPVPASSVDDPRFDASANWKGKRTNCPWNGRVWPMTSAHVADALARAARELAPDLRADAADLIRRFIRMLFHDGDPKRPNCYEHYNPYTGTPSLYRGVDDYQHSWIVDLILRHVVGVQPEPGIGGMLVVDPLPFELERFRAEGIPVRGHRIDVTYDHVSGFVVCVDGRERARLPAPGRVDLPMIEALVFDFDGLILDTEVPDYQSWHELFVEHGCVLPRAQWCAAIGLGDASMPFSPLDLLEAEFGRPLDRASVRLRRRARYLEMIAAERVMAGVEALIADAQRAGVKLAVASSSDRAWVTSHLSRLEIIDRFGAIKTADDVQRTKPEPDLYLAAVEALGVPPAHAVALEDSANGVTSAKRAGLRCIAVPNAMTREMSLDHADLRLESLQGLSLTALIATLERT